MGDKSDMYNRAVSAHIFDYPLSQGRGLRYTGVINLTAGTTCQDGGKPPTSITLIL